MSNLVDARDERPTTALLLAAGMGSRLAPVTDSTAKCLVEVSGVPILERLLRTLRSYGFTRLVVVVGHESDAIQDYLGDHSGDIQISYVVSSAYRTTNNIYSLWLAREVIDEPFLLVESDLVFNEALLEEMLCPDRVAISRQLPWMNGTTVTLDATGVAAFCLGEMSRPDATHYKTVNIYSFSHTTWKAICGRLEKYVAAKRTGDYYESVFAEMVADGNLTLTPVLFDADSWYEIDTLEDLAAAELAFPRYSETLKAAALAAATGVAVKVAAGATVTSISAANR
ncbi:MAG TPA: phosphocholine cytidylyltransferase family protein [Coriobacteriia bacterium]|jgi:choline kinase